MIKVSSFCSKPQEHIASPFFWEPEKSPPSHTKGSHKVNGPLLPLVMPLHEAWPSQVAVSGASFYYVHVLWWSMSPAGASPPSGWTWEDLLPACRPTHWKHVTWPSPYFFHKDMCFLGTTSSSKFPRVFALNPLTLWVCLFLGCFVENKATVL